MSDLRNASALHLALSLFQLLIVHGTLKAMKRLRLHPTHPSAVELPQV